MSVDDLVTATGALHLDSFCCNECCEPCFVSYANDPPPEVLSLMSKRKFYIVKRGALGGEAIYAHWDLAKVQVLGVSNVLHESCGSWDGARAIWAAYCHREHIHPDLAPLPPILAVAPPPYAAHAIVVSTPPASPPTTPRKFYRISGTPRVLIHRGDAEAELRLTPSSNLLIGGSLEDVEDEDDTPVFYRVFGSPRVQTNRQRRRRSRAGSEGSSGTGGQQYIGCGGR
ncbi:hypothetical protein B0H10DRAFT_2242455 [Mycena sp. CBHHK59/15]|nr:hypothetical protein B0H10DRAFT_2242455 [Mycena sp. CBHHK59/15]